MYHTYIYIQSNKCNVINVNYELSQITFYVKFFKVIRSIISNCYNTTIHSMIPQNGNLLNLYIPYLLHTLHLSLKKAKICITCVELVNMVSHIKYITWINIEISEFLLQCTHVCYLHYKHYIVFCLANYSSPFKFRLSLRFSWTSIISCRMSQQSQTFTHPKRKGFYIQKHYHITSRRNDTRKQTIGDVET